MRPLSLNDTDKIDLAALIDSRLLIQASSGGGKSWCIRRILERSHGQVQQIVIDVEGEFSTLREKFDYLHAGRGADVPAEPRSAAMLARKLLELGVNAIIDLYDLDHMDRKRFVRLFCDALLNAPKDLWHPVLIVVDEAHRFAPEKGQAESADAIINLASQGRKRGFCVVLATQRLSKLRKDAVAECMNKMIGLTGYHDDRKRAAEELGFTSKDQVFSMQNLSPGEFYAIGPAISREVKRIKVGAVETSHPKVGQRAKVKAPPPTAKIKDAIAKLMDLPAEAAQEAATIEGLKLELKQAMAENGRMQRHVCPKVAQDPAAIEKAVAIAIRRAEATTSDLKSSILKHADRIAAAILDLVAMDMAFTPKAIIKPRMMGLSAARVFEDEVRRHPAPLPTALDLCPPLPDDSAVAGGERKVLNAIAQQTDGMTREHITVQLGYKRSSRDTFIQKLKAKGCVEQRDDRLYVTDEGQAALGDYFEPLPIGITLRAKIRLELPEGERRVLDAICEKHPAAISREDIDEMTGYKRSSRDTFIQRLKARELVKDKDGGLVASDKLF